MLRQVKNPELWKLYKEHQISYWQAEEIDLSKDKFEELPENTKHWLKLVLTWFSNADVLVMNNIPNFIKDLDDIESQAFLGFQQMIEMIHTETYQALVEKYLNETEINEAYNSLHSIPTIKAKSDWLKQYENASFKDRLVVWACCELIMFSASFCTIFYIKSHHANILPGCFQANEFISRDEALHCKFACLLSKQHGVSENAQKIIKEAVVIEKQFVIHSMQGFISDITKEDMLIYIEYCADYLCEMLEINKLTT